MPNLAPAKGNKAFIRASKGFMGKQKWDGGDIAFTVELWAEVLRVLKPGGHMVAFSGTRTYHRMAVAIEDAGFEVRDQLAWVYGSGFPKSHDIAKQIDKGEGFWRGRAGAVVIEEQPSKGKEYERNGKGDPITDAARQWQGYGTALKPAWEPICLARKPLSESTVAGNVMRWGTGVINIDGCRIFVDPADRNHRNPLDNDSARTSSFGIGGVGCLGQGRWPANLCHDGSPEVMAGFPESSGVVGACNDRNGGFGYHGGAKGAYREGTPDSGSAARFFASFPQDDTAKRFHYTSKADADDRLGSRHPTVKPVDLMQWLVRLVCPKGATVLDPFAGTGTTGAASFIEGRLCVLIEREAEYLADVEKRMGMLLSGSEERSWKLARPEPLEALPLFSLTEPTA
jgi:DNA modification methylase